MNNKLLLIKAKLLLSLASSMNVFRNWRYALLATGIAIVFVQFLYWMLNLSLFWYFLTAQTLTILEKVELFNSIIGSYLSSLPLWQAITVVSLSIVQGVVIAVLIYIVRNQNSIDKKAVGGSTVAGMVAILSVGCVSCGTSIIAPLLGLFVSGATAGLSESINKIAIVIGLIAALYALYAVGLSAANVQAKKRFSQLV